VAYYKRKDPVLHAEEDKKLESADDYIFFEANKISKKPDGLGAPIFVNMNGGSGPDNW
jgi:hypothetical protein